MPDENIEHVTVTQEDALAFLIRKTVEDQLGREVAVFRDGFTEAMVGRYEAEGVKSIAVRLPSGEKVATFTVVEPKPRLDVDDAALVAFVEEHYPDLIETVEHPPVEAWTERRVSASGMKVLGLRGTDSGDVVTAAGEVVPEAKSTTPPPRSFTVRYEGGDEGRHRVLRAWQDGELAPVLASSTLPALAAAPEVVDEEVVDEESPATDGWAPPPTFAVFAQDAPEPAPWDTAGYGDWAPASGEGWGR